MGSNEGLIYAALTWAFPVLSAVMLHEIAHGYVALIRGDDTAKRARRLSLNPARHIDKVGTIAVPGLLIFLQTNFIFGWAKPVPVTWRRLKNPRRDVIWVALAGPCSNIGFAFCCLAVLEPASRIAQPELAALVMENLKNAVDINLVLAAFNMLPIPPLDGGRVLVGILPRKIACYVAKLEKAGILILLVLIFGLTWLGAKLGYDLDILGMYMRYTVVALKKAMITAVYGGMP